MCCGRWMNGLVVVGFTSIVLGGCVSLDDYRRLQAHNRNLQAEKQQRDQELFDARSVTDALSTRSASLERELEVKGELVANLRGENELLDELRTIAQKEIEEAAGRQTLRPIAIAGPKLPRSLDAALRRFADEHPSQVDYDAARGTIKWKSDLLFSAGSDVVKQSSMDALRSFTEVIKSPPAAGFEVLVVGHTDGQPIRHAKARHPTNWHLSSHRAISVANVLLQNAYKAARIGVAGYGEYRPVADNAVEEGRKNNRRVEIYLLPIGSIVAASADATRTSEKSSVATAGSSR